MKKIVPIVIVALLACAFLVKAIVNQKTLSIKETTTSTQTAEPAQSAESAETPTESQPEGEPPAKPITTKSGKEPIRGIYATAWVSGSSRMAELVQFVKDHPKINAIVIDVKDDTGYISYPSSVPLAQKIGSSSKRIANLPQLVRELKDAGIYTIARIVVFKDPLLATQRTDLAVKNRNGGLWKDRKGMIWVDPNSQEVWKYNLDIAKEVAEMGFSEVQFDYVRFLSDGKISEAVYPYSKDDSKEDVIRNFLKYAKTELNKMDVPVSADIFGLVLSVEDDLNIGQKYEKIVEAVDYVCPMVYPSHYPKGTFGIAEPDLHPYETLDLAMKAALRKVPSSNVKLRPWIQDFSLGNPYGKEQLEAQIKALEDNGIDEWLLWNPKNRYEASRYNF